MKHCPECNRNYADQTLSFCLEDGAPLIYGEAVDEPATALLYETDAAGDAPTRAQIHVTERPGGLPNAGERRFQSNGGPYKKFAIAALVIVLIGLAGFFGYRNLFPAEAGRIGSIAVLPFENRSGTPDTDYLSDGLAESLIYRLSQLPNVKVSPTSAVLRYKGGEIDAQKIGNELGVNAVMTGRLAQRGDNLTISVELVDVRDNKLLWGEQFEREASELLATQREIAAAITDKLRIKVPGEEAKGIEKHYTENNEAYRAYLNGRFHWRRRGGNDIRRAIAYFEEAITKDPGFALAWSGLADSYAVLPLYTTTTPVTEAMPKARQAALKAVELEPNLVEGHVSLGYVYFSFDWDFVAAENEYRKAMDLDPKYASARQFYAELLAATGKVDQALEQSQKAIELEPTATAPIFNHCNNLWKVGRLDEAKKHLDHALELEPDSARLLNFEAILLSELGDFNGAFKSCEKTNDDRVYKYCPAFVHAKKGDFGRAYQILSEPPDSSANDRYRADAYAVMDDSDKALEILERLYKDRSVYILFANGRRTFDGLRSDPRYKDLMRKVGLPH